MAYLENDNYRVEKLRMLKEVWSAFYTYGEVDNEKYVPYHWPISPYQNFYKKDLHEYLDLKEAKKRIRRYLHVFLNAREIKIIEMRFGLRDGIDHTLEEVGQEFHVTSVRIRAITQKALCKLRQAKGFCEEFNTNLNL